MAKQTNFYARLGIPVDATPEEIRHAYREAARRLHPDTNTEAGDTELFIQTKEAYEVLSDPSKRSSYDSTLPEDITVPPEVVISTYYSRNTVHRVNEPQLMYVLLEMMAKPGAKETPIPPLNVCLVLDCSTSMQGGLIDTVKSTAIELIRQIRPQDWLSIVTFSDRAEVLVPAGSKIDRNQIESSIRMLSTHGGTEILQGLQTGFNEVCRFQRHDYINHIILLTDGRTYGDEPGCFEIAEQASDLGIGISTMGIGNKWNDKFLDTLATMTGGSSLYVTRPREIRQFLKEKFSGFNRSYADRVTYQFQIGQGVELSYAFRLQPESIRLENETPIHFGPIPKEAGLSILMEFIVNEVPQETTQFILAEGQLTFEIPSRSIPSFTMRLKMDRPASNEPDPQPPPLPIIQALSRLTLYRMQERVHEDIESGNIPEATRRLQYLATNLLSRGERELARTVIVEAAQIQQNHSFSDEGQKRIKYGTRSLLMPAPNQTSTQSEAKNEENNQSESKGG
jgi:Ca-activated chloride channel family protein